MSNEEKFAKTIDDENLDEVAGGNDREIINDFKFIKALEPKSNLGVIKASELKQLDKMYGDYGHLDIYMNAALGWFGNYSVEYKKNGQNIYKRGDKVISRNDMLIELMRDKKKYLNLEDFI